MGKRRANNNLDNDLRLDINEVQLDRKGNSKKLHKKGKTLEENNKNSKTNINKTNKKNPTNQSLKDVYNKELSRIKTLINRAEKRGFIFDDVILPERPKNLTQKSVDKLKKFTNDELYKKAKYLDTETGEIITGEEGIKLERKKRAEKAQETRKLKKKADEEFWSGLYNEDKHGYLPNGGEIIYDNILETLLNRLHNPVPTKDYNGKKRNPQGVEFSQDCLSTLSVLVNAKIEEIGKANLGWQLQEYSDEIDGLTSTLLYSNYLEAIRVAYYKLAEIIKGSPLSFAELSDLQEEAEQLESYDEIE